MPVHQFQWLGQDYNDWPRWLVFRNVGFNETKIVIHLMDGSVTAELGDWIHVDAKADITIVKGTHDALGR